MLNKFYLLAANFSKDKNKSLLFGVSIIVIGLLLAILSQPLGALIGMVIGLGFILVGIYLGTIGILRAKEDSNEKNEILKSSFLIMLGLLLLVIGILVLSTKFMVSFFVFGIGTIVLFVGLMDLLLANEVRKRGGLFWYHLVSGIITVIASIVIMIILQGMIADDKLTSIGQIILIFIGIKLILAGISILLMRIQLKNEFNSASSTHKIHTKMNENDIEEADVEEVEES